MKEYKQPTGAVKGYESSEDNIILYLKNGGVYTYSYESSGLYHIEWMKHFAKEQQGLNTYLAKKRPPYFSVN